jgi:hypothetical protein
MRLVWNVFAQHTFVAFAVLAAGPVYAAGPSAMNISGALYDSSGAAITNSSVNFKLEVLDKNSTCVLYSEEHAGVNLGTAKGRFALDLGRGANGVNNLAGGSAFTTALFNNSGATGAFSGCPTGVTLAAGDERMIRVSYDLGGGFVAMTPDVPVNSSAYSMVAETLNGKAAGEFVPTT